MIDEIADRLAISQLIATYTIEGDRGRVDRLVEVFADDGVWEMPTLRAEGKAGILAAFGPGGARQGHRASAGEPVAKIIKRHHLTSSLVTFDGPDAAVGRTYWLNLSEKGPDHSGLYADRFVRVEGEWKIAHRQVRIDWRAEDSTLDPDLQPGGGPLPSGRLQRVVTG